MCKIDDEEIKHINEKLNKEKENNEEDNYSFGFYTSY